jgi:hypothetical protein
VGCSLINLSFEQRWVMSLINLSFEQRWGACLINYYLSKGRLPFEFIRILTKSDCILMLKKITIPTINPDLIVFRVNVGVLHKKIMKDDDSIICKPF